MIACAEPQPVSTDTTPVSPPSSVDHRDDRDDHGDHTVTFQCPDGTTAGISVDDGPPLPPGVTTVPFDPSRLPAPPPGWGCGVSHKPDGGDK